MVFYLQNAYIHLVLLLEFLREVKTCPNGRKTKKRTTKTRKKSGKLCQRKRERRRKQRRQNRLFLDLGKFPVF